MRRYPDGVDSVWLAVDDRGMLAGFITAGSGPIPGSVLAHATDVADIEGLLHDLLPAASEASLRVEIPKADSYVALCFHPSTDVLASRSSRAHLERDRGAVGRYPQRLFVAAGDQRRHRF